MTSEAAVGPDAAVDERPAIPGLTFRHATPDDWAALADVVNRSRRADGVDEVHTAASWANEWPESEMFRLERDMLVAEVGGAIVAEAAGYLVARDGALVAESFGSVLPEYRRRGIGTALYRATHARLDAEAASDPRPGPRERRSYALDDETADLALLDANGYVRIRFGFEMRRFLTGALPDHPLPPGLELRPVSADQHRAIFEADDEAFRDHWGHREPDEADFAARFGGPETDTSLWCVAWDGDDVVGSVQNAIYAEENATLGIARGWLDHVSVRRAWRGRGVAKALCAASFRVLRERGMTEAWLGVDAANPTGALALYEGLGFAVVRRWQAFGRPLDRPAPPGWRPGTGDAVEPAVQPAGDAAVPDARRAYSGGPADSRGRSVGRGAWGSGGAPRRAPPPNPRHGDDRPGRHDRCLRWVGTFRRLAGPHRRHATADAGLPDRPRDGRGRWIPHIDGAGDRTGDGVRIGTRDCTGVDHARPSVRAHEHLHPGRRRDPPPVHLRRAGHVSRPRLGRRTGRHERARAGRRRPRRLRLHPLDRV